MAPDYCIRWWHEKGLTPPDIDVVAFMKNRIAWRYAHGVPQIEDAAVLLGDSAQRLTRLTREVREGKRTPVQLLITSPPYHNVTNYYYDQWLRLWMLGGPDHPSTYTSNQYGGKYSNHDLYQQLLHKVFVKCKPLLSENAVIYVRTDQRETTYRTTLDVLTRNFPDMRITQKICPLKPERQTKAYSRGGAPKRANCEIDLILEPR